MSKADRTAANILRPRIRCHNQNDIAEIRFSAVVIGQRPMVHHLQEQVKYLGMSLLDFIQQHNRVRMLGDCVGQQSALIESHITGRCSNHPSNPLLKVIDLEAIGNISKKYNLISIIDNTFASPINQNPADFGIDIIIHSATKYLGGHSDILAGALASTKSNIEKIVKSSINYGGNLSEYTVWLLERSIKTLSLRVKKHNDNALAVSNFLLNHKKVKSVHYPGLESHPDHELSSRQMNGYGGMLSFELSNLDEAILFTRKIKLIKSAMSLGGVESTICSPTLTSHSKISKEERENLGIFDGLLRFSVGIEDHNDIINDLKQAFSQI